jgi:ATP-dependent exoDNAse (exonuclease V) beta subunit
MQQQPSFSIYDASAGSGKTYTLVKEYLRIILSSPKPDAYRNILAITFTNKAVHEMKSRIVTNLSEFASQSPSPKAADLMKALAAELEVTTADLQQKAKQIIRHIIHNYAAFDISTIDKFTHKVIRAFARDLNLPMTFEVSLDTENLLTEAVDAIIAQAGEDEVLTKLLVDFAMEKTDDDKSWDISREIMDTGRLALNENHRNEMEHLKEKTIPEFVVIKNKLTEAVRQLEVLNVELAQMAIDLLENHGVDPKSFSGMYFPKHLSSIRSGNFNPNNKLYAAGEDIRINKTAADKEVIENLIPELIEILANVYRNYAKRDFYLAFIKNITPLSLLNTVSNELSRIQKDQNILSIAEFNAIIHREIQNQPAPFIYERLGERYRHFFIDEFQDTSEMQWQNLVPLIDNALSGQDNFGQKGTLMIVGDPKQSIYRWRGGKAEQFIELGKAHNPFSNPDKQLFKLDTNWRSYSEVINFNNDFFEFVSGEFAHLDYKELYEKNSRQKASAKSGGYVNISFIAAPDTTEPEAPEKKEMHLISTLETIKRVLNLGFSYSDIAILTRKRDQGIAVANYLTENNIPLLSSETLQIATSTEVRFIINLLRFLKNGNDAEAKANFLQYIGKNKQTIIQLADFIADGMAILPETEFSAWLGTFNISLPFADIRKKSLYEAVETIVAKLVHENNAYVQYFLDIVLERDIRNQAGISDFLVYWEANASKFSIPSPEGKNAVKIMTIHKAKGLEFPVVIVPFAEEEYSRKPKSKLWIDNEDELLGLPRVLIDNNSAVEGFGSAAAVIYQQKKQEELLDNINVLYVALTRAEEQLYVISSMNFSKNGEPSINNMSAFFIRFLMDKNVFSSSKSSYEFGDAAKLSADKLQLREPERISRVDEPLRISDIKIAQRESLMWGSKQQDAIEYGNVIHEILSIIKTKEDLSLALTKAVEDGLIALTQRETVLQTLTEIISHPDLEEFYSAQNRVLNEQVIIQKQAGLIKPDRMVFGPKNEVYLLDYKTGSHNPKYILQLENYAAAIESMGYYVTKKALVYTGEALKVIHL